MRKPKFKAPSYQDFRRLAQKGNLIPLSREFLSDVETPVTGFYKVARNEEACFLLESVEHGEKIGRYSFVGSHPLEVFCAAPGEDITLKLEKRVRDIHLADKEKLPPFCGGFVGYLSYENISHYEKIRLRNKGGIPYPHAVFFLPSRLLIFDHLTRTLKIVVFAKKEGNLKQNYRKAIAALNEMTETFLCPAPCPATLQAFDAQTRTPSWKSNMTQSSFKAKIGRIKKYIRQGDCIQVVFSQRFDAGRTGADCFEIYRTLRSINPSPYMFFFRFRENTLIGSSPELLVKKYGNKAEIRPIAGTRRRGKNEQEDLALERELKTSPKELAEHLMLVDLGRNDLGRVCRFNSVKVEEFARTERYSHVMHLVSVVTGQLKERKDAFHLLRAAFPAGTVTGAPKVRAMQIIDELEDSARGPYAGCLGYFSLNGDMDMCIILRTILVHKNRAYVQAGAGIVYDSRPVAEYLETINKAKALFRAIEISKMQLRNARNRSISKIKRGHCFT